MILFYEEPRESATVFLGLQSGKDSSYTHFPFAHVTMVTEGSPASTAVSIN